MLNECLPDYSSCKGVAVHTRCPFNIRFSAKNKWLGQVTSHRGFAVFDSWSHGLRAGIVLLRNYIERQGFNTVSDIISRFAPSNENNTSAYIRFVENEVAVYSYCDDPFAGLGVTVDNYFAFYALCAAICKYESDFILSFTHFEFIVKQFNIKISLPYED